MKKSYANPLKPLAVLALSAVVALGLALPAFAVEGMEGVASADDYGSRDTVDDSGLTPITADDIADGTYTVLVETDSSMFSVADCQLTVEDGHMSAVLTLSGTGYGYLFAGTAEDAAAADMDMLVPAVEDEQGRYTYEIKDIPAVNEAFSCSAFSTRKQQWYGHDIMILATTLPYDSLTNPEAQEAAFAASPLADCVDGVYNIGVDASGSTVALCSPATLTVEDGRGDVTLEWSTGDYDTLSICGQTFDAIHAEPTVSTFTVPAQAFDVSIPATIVTYENGSPEELPCTVSLHSGTIELIQAAPGAGDECTDDPAASTAGEESESGGMGIGHIVILVVIGAAVVIALVRSVMKKRNG